MSRQVSAPSAESIGDIQNYLADFNPKESVSVISKSEPVLESGTGDAGEPAEPLSSRSASAVP